ncbi:ABC transporter ATP-binding protein [Oscillatoria acuminata]|uniref:ABC-type metal ion transport system, ATPase component n=1 Tax=Oscillatoria acuminata PCC 6304 TaxID=56110 RepID=K9TF68_9CYAN|nr:ATP-binding cassette domain-containing protein [Oscillatoria acuminata]AFY80756.1 ABC-type metal ion transport system, ATPase component [Oscillatoria acuminata PCC 6304]
MAIEQNAQLRLDRVSLNAAIAGARMEKPILNEICFDVYPGDRLAIVGPSGGGKTSLLRLMARLIDPSRGALYLDGQDYRKIPVLELRQQVTLVLQDSKLLGMTVQEAIAYPLNLRGMKSPQIQERVSTWMDRLHLPTEWLERTEMQLSVGQRQLVALCRALVIEPKILLLDEPTSALDVGRAEHLLQVLAEVALHTETTLIMVNHQLDLAQQFCNRLLYLHKGTLLEDLPEEQIDSAKLRSAIVQAEAEAASEWE